MSDIHCEKKAGKYPEELTSSRAQAKKTHEVIAAVHTSKTYQNVKPTLKGPFYIVVVTS